MLLLPALALLGVIQNKPAKPHRLAPGFTAVLPSAPRATSSPDPGEELGTYAWSSQTKAVTYSIVSRGLNEEELSEPVDRILAEFVGGKVDEVRGRLLEERDLVLNGWPGVEAKIRTSKGSHLWVRYYLRDRRGYSIIATAKNAAWPAEAKSVMDSVRFSGASGLLKAAGPVFSTYKVPDGEVSVDMPGAPEIVNREEDSEDGLDKVAEAVYGSRRYALAYKDAVEGDGTDSVPDFVESGEDGELRPKGKETRRRTYSIGDHAVTSVEFASEDGRLYGRTDVVKVGDRVYYFVATVPIVHRRSKELERFFGSIKLPAEKEDGRLSSGSPLLLPLG